MNINQNYDLCKVVDAMSCFVVDDEDEYHRHATEHRGFTERETTAGENTLHPSHWQQGIHVCILHICGSAACR